jgi:iron complex outermembrane receptor protein
MRLRLMIGTAFLLSLAPAFAQTTGPAETTEANDVIIVLGEGESRQVQTLTDEDMAFEVPGSSAIKLVESLPGVNYSAADPFGAYEWAVRINIRGFQQQQLGFTLDGVPLGDMSYGNYNGLHISRAIISENLDRVDLAQGAGLVSTNSTSNLGGTLQFVSRAPQDDFGGLAQVTGGGDSFLRFFGRLETGVIPGLGGKAALSYVDSNTDKWKGSGEQKYQQANFRFEQPLPVGVLSGYYNWSERRETDYQDLSLEMIRRLGNDWDNFAPNWDLAQRVADIANNRGDTGARRTNPAAGTVYPAPIVSVDDAYYDASGLRDDTLWRLSYDADLTETFSVSGTIYQHENEGQGVWFTPYANPYTANQTAPGQFSPVSTRTTEYDMNRSGVFGSATWTIGQHQVEGGFWYEYNDFDQLRRFYANPRSAPRPTLEFFRDPFATQWGFAYDFETTQFWLRDTWQVNEQLAINAGFKSQNVDLTVDTIANGFTVPARTADGYVDGTITSEDGFLPQIGFTYQIAEGSEIFGGYTENQRAFDLAPNAGRSQAQFDAIKARTNPETSKTYEAGWRYQSGPFQGVAAAYYVQFEDRLLGISQGPGIVGNASIISNVGGVETVGVELAGAYQINDEWSAYASYAYNNSEYEDNVRNAAGAVLQATGGKTVVNAPENLFKADLGYDNGALFAKLSVAYTGSRFFSYVNNAEVDGYTLADLTAGYRFSGNEFLEGLELQFNVTNLADEEYVSTIGTNGFNVSPDNQTLMTGAPRQVFVTLKKGF